MINKSKNEQDLVNEGSKLLSKVNKIDGLDNKISYLKAQITLTQNQYGNKSFLLYSLIEKLIKCYKEKGDTCFESKNYSASLSVYKTSLKYTEPLPGSNWEKYTSWSANRINIMKSIASTYEKLEQYEQASEYLRLSINLEDTFGHTDDNYDSRYNQLYYLIGNKLVLMEQYAEALKYLIKVEKKMNDDYHIQDILNQKKLDKKINADFIKDTPSRYLTVLKLISKSYIKVGNYSQSDIYYDKESELVSILQKDISIAKSLYSENLDVVSHKLQHLKTDNSNKTSNLWEKRGDLVEENDDVSQKNNNNNSTYTFTYNHKLETDNLRSISPNSKEIDTFDNKQRAKSVDKRKKDNIPIRNTIKKLTKVQEQKLKQIIQETNKYPPLNFKFKKPILHKKIKQLPLLEPKIRPKSKDNSTNVSENSKKPKSTNKSIPIKNSGKSSSQIKELSVTNKINKKLEDIQLTLKRQTSLNTISSSQASKKRKESETSQNKTISSFKEDENDDEYKNLRLIPKNPTIKRESKVNAITNTINRISSKQMNPNHFILPPLKKNETSKRLLSIDNSDLFFSNKNKSKGLNSTENQFKNTRKQSRDIKQNGINNNNLSIGKNINFKPAYLDFKKKDSSLKPNSLFVPNNQFLSHNNLNAITNQIIDVNKKIALDKKFIENIAINQPNNNKQIIPEIINSKVLTRHKKIDMSGLICDYFSYLGLVLSNKFEKATSIYKREYKDDIWLIKSINNNYHSINIALPLLEKQSNELKGPFLSIDIFFYSYMHNLLTKYNMKIKIFNEHQSSSDELVENIQSRLNNSDQNKDLVWSIVLFYFENWFINFRNKYDKTIHEESDQTKSAFYVSFLTEMNSYIDKIAKWETSQTMMNSNNKHISLLLKYFTAFVKYLEIEKSVIGNKIKFKELPEEMIKIKRKQLEYTKDSIFDKMNEINQIGNAFLLKKILFDSFQIQRYSRFSGKDNQSTELNLFQLDYTEDLLYDGCVLYKGILSINTKYIYLTISVRTFEKAIQDSNKQHLIDLPLNKLVTKAKIIDFEKLKFLSIHPKITKMYEDLVNDLNKKFYDKTQYKTFIQFTFVDLTSGSNWYDITYLSWEILLKISGLLQKDVDNKYIHNWDLSINYIIKKMRLHSFFSIFLTKYIEKYCAINNGTFYFNSEINRDQVYNNIFIDFYDDFNHFNEFTYSLRNNKQNETQLMNIQYNHLYFYHIFLKEINKKYYDLYFKNNKFYQEEKVIIQEIDPFILGIKKKLSHDQEMIDEERIKSNNKMAFHLYLTIKNHRYLILFKIFIDEQKIVPEGDIKNYLISEKKEAKLFIQFRNIISNELLHSIVTSKRCIINMLNCYENNEKLLNSYFKNLFHIIHSSFGRRAILDFTFNAYSLKTRKAIESNINLIKRISLMLLNRNNKNLQQVIDDLKYVMTYKKCFKQKNGSILLFNYQIFKENKINQIDNQKQLNLTKIGDSQEVINKNLYSKVFGKFKVSKFEKRAYEAYRHNYNYKYESVSFYFYFTDIYIPAIGSHVNFVLSSKDLNIILKKIKNKNVQDKYFKSYEEFINLIPRKITISDEFSGKKVLLNFTKYKHLRMDWREQMEQKSKSNLLTKQFQKTKEKFELILYLKPNYLNISSRDSLYDISTNELKLVIKTIKIYCIREKSCSCLVTIFYHRILEYWTLILFFPHNSRKFISVIEPKEVSKIVQSNNFMEMDVVNDETISEKDIWKHVIASSKISSNIEGNAYFEVFTTKLLLKEFLYNGFEIISDGYNDELNRVIYVEISLKTKNLFILASIEEIIDKIELDYAHIIFQSFSFHDLSWHKENFKLEDFETLFSEKVISNSSVVKVKEMSKEEILLNMPKSNIKGGQLIPKIIETSKIEVRKFFQFAMLRKLIVPIIRPYVSSQQHMFEMQLKSIENKGFDENSLTKLIESIKYDRAHRKAISSIYKQKLENQIVFQRIYSEYISYNPPILASISLNLVKELVIITLYYPYQTNNYDLKIDFSTIKELFFPYFNDILIIDKQELGKRILKRYDDFIKKSPAFIKLLRNKR